jgi:hypothetical protein
VVSPLFRCFNEVTDKRSAVGRLRLPYNRPRHSSAAYERDELAPLQLIELHPLTRARMIAYRIDEHHVRGMLRCGISTASTAGLGQNLNPPFSPYVSSAQLRTFGRMKLRRCVPGPD